MHALLTILPLKRS